MEFIKKFKNSIFWGFSLAFCIAVNMNAAKSRLAGHTAIITIEKLSDAIILKIMENLHGVDLNNAAAVSRRFHELANKVKFPRLLAEHHSLVKLYADLEMLNDQAMGQLSQSSRLIEKMRAAAPVNAGAMPQINPRQVASQSLVLISYPIYGVLYGAFCNSVGDPLLAGLLALVGQVVSDTVPAVRNALRSHVFIRGFTNYGVFQAMTLCLSRLASSVGIPTDTLIGSLIVPILVMFFYINIVLR